MRKNAECYFLHDFSWSEVQYISNNKENKQDRWSTPNPISIKVHDSNGGENSINTNLWDLELKQVEKVAFQMCLENLFLFWKRSKGWRKVKISGYFNSWHMR